MYSEEKNRRSYLETLDSETCTGCRACSAACPTGCIAMKQDKEGFYYPVIDTEKCVDCGKCKNVCPHIKCNSRKLLRKPVAAVHRDKRIVNKSSSGGTFYALAQAMEDKYGSVVLFGACMDDEFNVIHRYAYGVENISKLLKSKYVLSDTKDTYSEAKKFLDNGQAVLYSGTPCQIAGLRSYLGQDYEKLLCIDIFCHGAGSNSLFKRYISEESKNGKIIEYSFRHKNNDGARNVRIVYKDGREEIRSRVEDLYMSGYAEALFYRPSCLQCKYACEEREGDVSIGDGWKINRIYPELNPDNGVSIVLFNNEKGASFKEKLSSIMDLYDVSYDFVVSTIDTMRSPTSRHPKRERFFWLAQRISVHRAISFSLIRNNPVRRIAKRILRDNQKQRIKKVFNILR